MATYKERAMSGSEKVYCYTVCMCVPVSPPGCETCVICDKFICHKTCRPEIKEPPKPGDVVKLADGTEGTVQSVTTEATASSVLEEV